MTQDEDQPSSPEMIPPGVSAVRWMLARAEGKDYRSLPTLEAARGCPDAVLIMEADCGGQILLTCPVRSVSATPSALLQLPADLENITWGGGFDPDDREPSGDAEMFFEIRAVGSGVAGGMGGAAVCDGLWIHRELDALDLRHQIRDVLAGICDRVVLPKGFPQIEGLSITEARRFSDAVLTLFSTRQRRLLVTCALSLVKADEARLLRLIQELDTIAEREICLPPGDTGVESPGRVQILVQGAANCPGIQLGGSGTSPMLQKRRAAIESIILGEDISLS